VTAKDESIDEEAAGLRGRILHRYFVRIHMTLILSAVIASGVLSSKLMLMAGMHSLRLRYPLAVLASYLVFLGLIRVWIWYISLRTLGMAGVGDLGLGNVDVSGGGGGGWGGGFGGGTGGGSFRFGGGDSGGGGASSSWDENVQMGTAQIAASSSGKSGWFSGMFNFNFDLDDDGWVLILLAVLILGIVCAGGYLIYAAPHFLPEAASQAFLATALTRVSKEEHHGWMPGVLRATVIPFAVILILAGALGWGAHSYCPGATRLMDTLPCVSK